MEPSPNYRSMYGVRGRPGILGGLLPDSDRPMASKQVFEDSNMQPPVGQSPSPGPDGQYISSSPSLQSLNPERASFLNAPASSYYARTPPPAVAPSNVFARPGATADYRQRGALMQTLLDSPNAAVAGNMDASAMQPMPPMPLPPVAEPLPPVANYPPAMPQASAPAGDQFYAPPMEAEFIGRGGNQALPMLQPQFLQQPQYQAMQPSRRYEVL